MTFSMSFRSLLIFTFVLVGFSSGKAWGECPKPDCEDCTWEIQASQQCSKAEHDLQPAKDKSLKSKDLAQKAIDACVDQHKTSIGVDGNGDQGSKCDWQNDGMIKAANSQLGQLALSAASMSPAAACNGLGEASKYANAAVAGFNMSCKMEVGKCIDSCSSAVSACEASIRDAVAADNTEAAANPSVAAVTPGPHRSHDVPKDCEEIQGTKNIPTSKLVKCKVFSEKVAVNAGAIVMLAINNNQNLANCNKLQQMIGQAGPSAPGVTPGDCTNPANAGNPVCAGLHANAVGNFGGATIAGGGVGVGGARAGAAISGVAGGGLAGMGLPSDLGSNVAKSAAAGGLATAGAGGGGGGAVGGGGGLGGGAAKKKAAGAPADPRDTKMYGGLVTGAGSGSGSSGSSSSGDNGSGKKAVFGAQYANQPGATPPGFDANKYNPNMKYEGGRNLAGVTGPDGITGPNSNLFNKVNSQFNEQTMQDRFFAP